MELKKLNVSFRKRTAEQIEAKVKLNDATVPEFNVELDFSELDEEQVLLWAARGIIIHIQSQQKSGKLGENITKYVVPKSGDRARLSDTDKARRLVAALLKKDVAEVTDQEVLAVLTSLGK